MLRALRWSDPVTFYKAVEPGTVRGGIIGQHHDARCQAFEQRQANALGMRLADASQ